MYIQCVGEEGEVTERMGHREVETIKTIKTIKAIKVVQEWKLCTQQQLKHTLKSIIHYNTHHPPLLTHTHLYSLTPTLTHPHSPGSMHKEDSVSFRQAKFWYPCKCWKDTVRDKDWSTHLATVQSTIVTHHQHGILLTQSLVALTVWRNTLPHSFCSWLFGTQEWGHGVWERVFWMKEWQFLKPIWLSPEKKVTEGIVR